MILGKKFGKIKQNKQKKDMEKIDLERLKELAHSEISQSKNLKELDQVFKRYLGKNGQVSLILKDLKTVSPKEKAKLGKEINEFKSFLEVEFVRKGGELRSSLVDEETGQWIDTSVPGKKVNLGHLHPLTQAKREIMMIFQGMGFNVAKGPEAETEWYNFDALNIPADHPARDMWDTFWLKSEKPRLLLRTHTSPVQVRYMEKNQPPLKIIVPDKIFRHEATDATHEAQFYQLEGLMIGEDISVANFKAILQEFLRRFFGKEILIRLRPSFFPFTEPSFEMDIGCALCDGKGCLVCKESGWIELMGAGMVHPKVLENAGLDSRKWQGFAFGVGLDRLTMMKYKINEIRLFHSGDLRFLQQF